MMNCVCSIAHCSSTTDTPVVSSAGDDGGGGLNAAAPETGTTEDVGTDSVQGERMRKHPMTRLTSLSHSTFRTTTGNDDTQSLTNNKMCMWYRA